METVKNDDDLRIIFGTKAIGREIGMNRQAVDTLIRNGHFQISKIGGRYATTRADLRRALAETTAVKIT
jgi:hypothetical protein